MSSCFSEGKASASFDPLNLCLRGVLGEESLGSLLLDSDFSWASERGSRIISSYGLINRETDQSILKLPHYDSSDQMIMYEAYNRKFAL